MATSQAEEGGERKAGVSAEWAKFPAEEQAGLQHGWKRGQELGRGLDGRGKGLGLDPTGNGEPM